MQEQVTRFKLQRGRIIYGFPTTGKSEFVKRQREAGAFLIDTDELQKVLFPKISARRKKSGYGRQGNTADWVQWWIGRACRLLLSRYDKLVIVTNLWDPVFRKGFGFDGLLPLGFTRESAFDTFSLIEERGNTTALTPSIVYMWWRAVAKYAPSLFKHFVVLPKDGFISDYVSLGPHLLDVREQFGVDEYVSRLGDLGLDMETISMLDSGIRPSGSVGPKPVNHD